MANNTKPRKPLPKMSKARAEQMKRYRPLRDHFLDTHTICFKCNYFVPRSQRQLHHFYGTVGELLCWAPGFRMADRICHREIELSRNDAVLKGYRAPNNLFGRPSLVIPKPSSVDMEMEHFHRIT